MRRSGTPILVDAADPCGPTRDAAMRIVAALHQPPRSRTKQSSDSSNGGAECPVACATAFE
jgi:hypothetical protein